MERSTNHSVMEHQSLPWPPESEASRQESRSEGQSTVKGRDQVKAPGLSYAKVKSSSFSASSFCSSQ